MTDTRNSAGDSGGVDLASGRASGDLAAAVLAAIEAREARIERVRRWFDPKVVPVPVRQFTERGGECFATPAWVQVVGERVWDADEDLRHCEADRRTVERHTPIADLHLSDSQHSWIWIAVCSACYTASGEYAVWPCPELLDRAAAYGIEVMA